VQQQMANIIRRAVLDKMISAKDVSTMLRYLRQYRSLLITQTEEDPFNLYGFPERETGSKKATLELRKQHFEMVRKSSLFSKEDKIAIKKQLEQVGQKTTLPEKVQLAKNNGKLQFKSNDLGIAQHVSLHQQAKREQDANRDQEMEL